MPITHVAPDSGPLLQDIATSLYKSKKVVVITGAGISTNSGIPDFRSENGLYSLIQAQFDIATKEATTDEGDSSDSADRSFEPAHERPAKRRKLTPDGDSLSVLNASDRDRSGSEDTNHSYGSPSQQLEGVYRQDHVPSSPTRARVDSGAVHPSIVVQIPGSDASQQRPATPQGARSGPRVSRVVSPELLPKQQSDESTGFLSSPRASSSRASLLPSDSDPSTTLLSSSPLSSPPPILIDPYQEFDTPYSPIQQHLLSQEAEASRIEASCTSSSADFSAPSSSAPSRLESNKSSPGSTPALTSQASSLSSASTLPALPNLKGRDLFDSSIWADPVKTSVFYTFTTTLRQRVRDVTPTPSHQFLTVLRDSRKLVRCYTQNIDQLEERVGLATSLGLGTGSRGRFSTKSRLSTGTTGTTTGGPPAVPPGPTAQPPAPGTSRIAGTGRAPTETRSAPPKVPSDQGKDSRRVSASQEGAAAATGNGAAGNGAATAMTIPRCLVGDEPGDRHDSVHNEHNATRRRTTPSEQLFGENRPRDSRSVDGRHHARAHRTPSAQASEGRPPPPAPGSSLNDAWLASLPETTTTTLDHPDPLPLPTSAPVSPKRGVECVFLHGSLNYLRCFVCARTSSWDEADRELDTLAGRQPSCPHCAGATAAREERGKRALGVGKLRPDIVLYGEEHPSSHLISPLVQHDLSLAPDMLLILGTSLRVHGLKVLVKEFAKAVHNKGGKVVFVNYTKPPGSVWSDVIDYWVEWDCDAWVRDLKNRKPALWLPPGAPAEVCEPKPAKPKRQNTKNKRRSAAGDKQEAQEAQDGQEKKAEVDEVPSRPKELSPKQPSPKEPSLKKPPKEPKRKMPPCMRDDKHNGAYFTLNILANLRRITGTPRRPKATPAKPRAKRPRKSAPAKLESAGDNKNPTEPVVPAPVSRSTKTSPTAPGPATSRVPGIAGSVKFKPRTRKPKVFDGCELEKPRTRKRQQPSTPVTPPATRHGFVRPFPGPVSPDMLLNPIQARPPSADDSTIPPLKDSPIIMNALGWAPRQQQQQRNIHPNNPMLNWKDGAFSYVDPLQMQQYTFPRSAPGGLFIGR